jgi:retron-type reverse transcriptase
MAKISEPVIKIVNVNKRKWFDTVRYHVLLQKVARRVDDDDVLHLLKLQLKASRKRGIPQGGVISRLLSNVYLNEVVKPMLRGWVNYFAVGHSSRCLSFIRNWVEHKVRRHLGRARQRQGFGWKRWSRRWLYDTLGLFDEYRVRYQRSVLKVVPAP